MKKILTVFKAIFILIVLLICTAILAVGAVQDAKINFEIVSNLMNK